MIVQFFARCSNIGAAIFKEFVGLLADAISNSTQRLYYAPNCLGSLSVLC